jgi:uncharacterized membrane protein YdjX (TVP38/TMEM64 family)
MSRSAKIVALCLTTVVLVFLLVVFLDRNATGDKGKSSLFPSLFTLENAQRSQKSVAELYQTRPGATLASFFALLVLVTALSLPGAAPLALISGAVFKLTLGSLVCSFGASIGATIAFSGSRYLFQDRVRRSEFFGARMLEVDRGLEGNEVYVPVLP